MRTRTRRLMAAALTAVALAACAGGPSSPTGPVTTEPATETEGGEVDSEAAQARADDLLGRSEAEVVDLPDVRVVRRDGDAFDVDLDLVPGRMNVTIEDGVVVDVAIEEDPVPPTEQDH